MTEETQIEENQDDNKKTCPWTRACGCMTKIPLIGRFFDKSPRISVIRFAGVIADTARTRNNISYDKYAPLIDKAFEKANTAVVLQINCPGGSPAQSALIGDHIRRQAIKHDLPVIAFVEDVAASGGYWLACAADEIYAQDVSIVGSIGVISASFGFQDLIKKYGVERRMHTSGKEKDFLDPFQEESPEDVVRLKAIQVDIHNRFITWVKARRREKLQGDDKDLFEGQFWTGAVAQENGIIDGLSSPIAFIEKQYGEEARIKVIAPEKKLLPSLIPFIGGSLAQDLAVALEERTARSRYGL